MVMPFKSLMLLLIKSLLCNEPYCIITKRQKDRHSDNKIGNVIFLPDNMSDCLLWPLD